MRPLIKNDHPIKKLLIRLGITYKELSLRTGINIETLCRYANYRKNASQKNCYKIIDYAVSKGIDLKLEDLMPRKPVAYLSIPDAQGIKRLG